MTDREEQFEDDLRKAVDFPQVVEREFKGDEINKWTRVAFRALAEFLQPKEGIMVEDSGHHWFVWRIGKSLFRVLNPEAEVNKALKGIKVGELVKVTGVIKDGRIPTTWEEITD